MNLPQHRVDHCGCAKPTGVYGRDGWHWRQNPEHPESSAQDIAVERCRAYASAVRRGERLDGRSPR